MPEQTTETQEELIKHLGELLKTFNPNVETKADKAGVSITLNFSSKEIERSVMRKLTALAADAAV